MHKIPPLKSLQAFEAASRLGSFVAAAEELHLTPSAVSHRLRELEEHLGLPLFERMHRSVVLTDAGRRYAREIAEAFGRIDAATQGISRKSRTDLLTVHTVPSFAALWLMPRIPRFSALHADIDVRIHASVGNIDLEDGVVDLDIRYGNVKLQTTVQSEPLPPETIVVLCSPGVRDGPPPIRRHADLKRQTLIHGEANLYAWSDWQKDHPGVTLRLDRGPRFDRTFMSISAAADGLGVCLESLLLAQRELQSGRLVLPFGTEGPQLSCHCLNYLRSRARIRKIKVFREWLLKELETEPVEAVEIPANV